MILFYTYSFSPLDSIHSFNSLLLIVSIDEVEVVGGIKFCTFESVELE